MDAETLKEILKSEFKMLRRHRHLAKRPRGQTHAFKFVDFCRKHLLRSQGQLFQDLWVLFALKEKRSGYFVEFSRKDDPTLSNSRLLEKAYGWIGIVSVPSTDWQKDINRDRKCVLDFQRLEKVPPIQKIDVALAEPLPAGNGGNGSASEDDVEQRRPTSVGQLMEAHKAPKIIDYLSINARGKELAQLQSIDFDHFDIKLVSVEHNFTDTRNSIREFMRAHGYRRQFTDFSKLDDWYVKRGKEHGGGKAKK